MASAKRRYQVRQDGRRVVFVYDQASQAFAVTINGVRRDGQAATVAQARSAVRALLGGA